MYQKNKSINRLKTLKYIIYILKSIEIDFSISLYIIRTFGISHSTIFRWLCREEETNLRYDGIGSYGHRWGGVMRWTKCHTVKGMYNNLEGDN
jgi:hypothetical protein